MKYIYQSFMALVMLTVITGIIYPIFIYAVGKSAFPFQANGSIIQQNGKAIGSQLIGQQFTQPKYFWSRPSATANYPYNALASGGSNLGPLNPQLLANIKANAAQLSSAAGNSAPIPVDLVTASGSGLDPDISVAAAYYQMQRIAQVRHISVSQVQELIDDYGKFPLFGFIGEPRVNVLQLNLALDQLASSPQEQQ